MILLKWIKLPILIGFLNAIIAQEVDSAENEIIPERPSVLPNSDQPTTILFSKVREENTTIFNNDLEVDKNSPDESVSEAFIEENDEESVIQETIETKQYDDISYNFSYDIPKEDTNATNVETTPEAVKETILDETVSTTTEMDEAGEKYDETIQAEDEKSDDPATEENADAQLEVGKASSTTEKVEDEEKTEAEVDEEILDTETIKEIKDTEVLKEDKTFEPKQEDDMSNTKTEEENINLSKENEEESENTSNSAIETSETEESSKNSDMKESIDEDESILKKRSESLVGDSQQENSTLQENITSAEPVIILGRSKFTNSPDNAPATTALPTTEPIDLSVTTEADLLFQRETFTSESPVSQYSPEPVDPNLYTRSNFDNNYNQQYPTNDYYEENEYSMLPENCDPNDPTNPCGIETPKPVSNPVAENQYPTESPYDEYGYNRYRTMYREYDGYHPNNNERYNTASYDEFSSNIDVDNEKIQIEYKWPVSHQSPNFRQCHMALDPGTGPDEINTWYYDRQEGKCKWFAYGGYGGNANRFYSRGACIHLCIMNNDNPCLQSNIECWGSTKCESYRDKDCIQYQESRNRNVDEICPPAQPVCMTKRKSRIQPKVDKTNIPSECSQPMDAGSCSEEKPVVRYYYDTYLQACKSFYYFKSRTPGSNCGGNSNRFVTKDDCMNYCSP